MMIRLGDRTVRVKIRHVVTITVLGATTLGGQQTQDARIRSTIQVLAADSLGGRAVGSRGLDIAANFIAHEFEAIGLSPLGGSYFHEFTVSPHAPAVQHVPAAAGVAARNVVGVIPGSSLVEEYIVVGAHYDHLGEGGFGSLEPDSRGVVHNGADDNASGTAAIIEVARTLVESRPERSIIIVAFSAEELGLLGSAAFVTEAVVPTEAIYAMINLDMVGRLRDRRLAVFGAATASEFGSIVEAINDEYAFTLSATGDGYGSSDHASFYAVGVPVIHLFTGVHEDYHRTTDDWEKIDIAALREIAGFTADLALALANRSEALTFVEAPPRATGSARGYGAYLGTIPDMTGSPGGVRITGVRSRSPAEAAGLQGGDIIVKIGTHVVGDLFAMTDALRAFRPGDKTTIAYRRGRETIETEVTFGRRGSE